MQPIVEHLILRSVGSRKTEVRNLRSFCGKEEYANSDLGQASLQQFAVNAITCSFLVLRWGHTSRGLR